MDRRVRAVSLAAVVLLVQGPVFGQSGADPCSSIKSELDDVLEFRDKQSSGDAYADASRVYDRLAAAYNNACGESTASPSPGQCARIKRARDRANAIQNDVRARYEQTQLSYLDDLSVEAFHVYLGVVGLYTDACGARTLIKIGQAASVAGVVQAIEPDGTTRTLTSGAPVYLGDRIVSDGAGRLQVFLLDDTVFTVGPNADMVLDEFVYDPATGVGKLSARIIKGVFRFITGKIAAKDPARMKVKVPVGAVGIRGTDFILSLEPRGVSIYVNEGTVLFEEASSAQTVEIASGNTGTFSQREADVRAMTGETWEELVASIAPPGSNAIDGTDTDANPLYLLVWFALLLLTLPFGVKLRRKRLAAKEARAPGHAGFCPGCGTARRPGAAFCRSCGRPLKPLERA